MFLENPYLRLLSNVTVESSAGTRPHLMYVIAVDDNGTREEQKNLSSIASFEFVNLDEQAFDYSSRFNEFIETSFQNYSYVLPVLTEDAEGSYTLTLGCYIIVFTVTYVKNIARVYNVYVITK